MANLAPPTTPESWATRMIRWGFNLAPVYRGTGAWVTHISADWRDVRIKLPLSLRTRNYVGTIFGGSMYAAVDPFYMIMLIRNLGTGYTVWDKAASIRFRKPQPPSPWIVLMRPILWLSSILALVLPACLGRAAEVEKVIYIRRDTPEKGGPEHDTSGAATIAARS